MKYLDRAMVVASDGQSVYLAGTTTLAGSCCSLLDAFRNLVNVIRLPVEEASAKLSANPVRASSSPCAPLLLFLVLRLLGLPAHAAAPHPHALPCCSSSYFVCSASLLLLLVLILIVRVSDPLAPPPRV
jgi:hypothetical protein